MLWLIAIPGVACGGEPVVTAERIVLVSIDTLRADHVGAYGDEAAHTPALDGLAARGARFVHALSPAPLTLPSHASLLTGLEPPRHGVRHNSTFRLATGLPTLAEVLAEQGFTTAAFVGAIVLDRQYGLARGFEVYDDQMDPRRAAGDKGFAERRADRVVDAAINWLSSAPARFFLWVHLYDPHGDYAPPPGFRAAFPGQPYRGEIAFADAQIGRLLDAVEGRFPDGRTLIVATSDHGEAGGEHGEVTHSMAIYDSTQHVPLLMQGPGIRPGTEVEETVSLVDVAPTILEQVGAPPLEEVDGVSLVPRLRGDRSPPRPVYLETVAPQIDFGWSPLLGLVADGYKYIRAPRPELYHLADDQTETHDLAVELPDLVKQLDDALAKHLTGPTTPPQRLEPDSATRESLEALGYVVEGETTGIGDRTLGQVGGIDPKDAREDLIHMMAAMRLVGLGRPEQALARLEGAREGGRVVWQLRAEAALAAGDAIAAETFARRALEASPELVTGKLRLGRVLERQERWEEARALYQDVEKRDPAQADALVGLGRIAERAGRLDEAAAFYERAAERRGASAEALWRLAALRIEQGEDPGTLFELLPWEAVSRPEAALRLSHAERTAGLNARARTRLKQASGRAPENGALRAAIAELDAQGAPAVDPGSPE